MESFWELKSKYSPNYLSIALIDVSSMSTNLSGWSSVVKSLMEGISWLMPEQKPPNSLKISLWISQDGPLLTVFPSTLTLILCTTQYVPLDQQKFLHLTLKMKNTDCICSSHQEHTTDIHAALQAKEGKQPRLNSKRMILAKWLVKMLWCMSPKCTFFPIKFMPDSRRIKGEEIRNWIKLDLWEKQQ